MVERPLGVSETALHDLDLLGSRRKDSDPRGRINFNANQNGCPWVIGSGGHYGSHVLQTVAHSHSLPLRAAVLIHRQIDQVALTSKRTSAIWKYTSMYLEVPAGLSESGNETFDANHVNDVCSAIIIITPVPREAARRER